MFCKKCGKQIPDGSSWCTECGADLRKATGSGEVSQNPQAYSQPTDSTGVSQNKNGGGKKKKHGGAIAVAVIAVIVAVVAIGCFVAYNVYDRSPAVVQKRAEAVYDAAKNSFSDLGDGFGVDAFKDLDEMKDYIFGKIEDETGIVVDSSGKKCKAYIKLTLDDGTNNIDEFIYKFVYYDIKSGICLKSDVDDAELKQSSKTLKKSDINYVGSSFKKDRETQIEADAYTVFTIVQMMVATEYAKANPDYAGNITAKTITSDQGVNVDSDTEDCKAYVAVTIARTKVGKSVVVSITSFEYYDIETDTLYNYDRNNYAWDVYKSGDDGYKKLSGTTITLDGVE